MIDYEDEYDHNDPLPYCCYDEGYFHDLEDGDCTACACPCGRRPLVTSIRAVAANLCPKCRTSLLTVEDVGVCRQCRLTEGVLA